jgi:hypothetical protein
MARDVIGKRIIFYRQCTLVEAGSYSMSKLMENNDNDDKAELAKIAEVLRLRQSSSETAMDCDHRQINHGRMCDIVPQSRG